MGVDRTTPLSFFSITVDNRPQYIKDLIKQANEDDQNNTSIIKERGCNAFSITSGGHSFKTDEYYFEDNEITISGEAISPNGKTNIYLSIPISDEVLIDILANSMKRLGKLKTALETLK